MAEVKQFTGIDIKKLEKELLSQIDATDAVQRNKVAKYIKIEKMIRGFFDDIEERGLMIETKNGAQEFAKHNPLIDKIRPFINTQLEIENSLGLNVEKEQPQEVKRSASDLI